MDDGNDNNCRIQGEQVIEGGAREVGEEGGRGRLNILIIIGWKLGENI